MKELSFVLLKQRKKRRSDFWEWTPLLITPFSRTRLPVMGKRQLCCLIEIVKVALEILCVRCRSRYEAKKSRHSAAMMPTCMRVSFAFSSAFLLFPVFGTALDYEPSLDQLSVEKGRRQLELVHLDSRSPIYGQCWVNALRELETGCRSLTDEVQSRLALSLASCFLVKAGKTPLTCPPSSPVSKCLNGIDDQSFGAYTAFFTHSQDMCFFLQSQVWRYETGHLINKLSSSSAEVAEQLEAAGERLKESSLLQQEILGHQASALAGLERLHSQGAMLEENIRVSGEVFDEFRESVHSHEAVLLSIFQRLADLQGFILRELTLVSTVAFYVLGTIICYLLTSTERTRRARFGVFALLTMNALLEYLTGRIYSRADKNWDGNISDVSAVVSSWVWLLRKLTCGAILCILAWTSYFHQDLTSINLAVMKQLRQDNDEIKRLLLQLGRSPLSANLMNGDMRLSVVDGSTQVEGRSSPTLAIRSALTRLVDVIGNGGSPDRSGVISTRNMGVLSDDEDWSADTGRGTLRSSRSPDRSSVASRASSMPLGSSWSNRGSPSPMPSPVLPRRVLDLTTNTREGSPYNLRSRSGTPSVSGSRAGSVASQGESLQQQMSSSSAANRKKSASRRLRSKSRGRGVSASRRRVASRGRQQAAAAPRSPLGENGNPSS